jgi:hypothetical protein
MPQSGSALFGKRKINVSAEIGNPDHSFCSLVAITTALSRPCNTVTVLIEMHQVLLGESKVI